MPPSWMPFKARSSSPDSDVEQTTESTPRPFSLISIPPTYNPRGNYSPIAIPETREPETAYMSGGLESRSHSRQPSLADPEPTSTSGGHESRSHSRQPSLEPLQPPNPFTNNDYILPPKYERSSYDTRISGATDRDLEAAKPLTEITPTPGQKPEWTGANVGGGTWQIQQQNCSSPNQPPCNQRGCDYCGGTKNTYVKTRCCRIQKRYLIAFIVFKLVVLAVVLTVWFTVYKDFNQNWGKKDPQDAYNTEDCIEFVRNC